MLVDSFRYLPRSFLGLYQNVPRPEGEEQAVWAPFEPRLAEGSIALLTSAGLSLVGEQEPFDLDRERREPTWGDPTYRVIPHRRDGPLAMSHLHVNNADVLADHNVALPTDILDALVAEGRVGAAAPAHVSVMGYQEAGLDRWRHETAPAVVALLQDQRTDGVVLAPV
ncbi:MAG: D-proline reductase (dithiol) PrdB [Acidimicrobiaceae bacterium]|nr:D-proline reductase (dithiol) PrdB [Acidimicrobiaceae bacterium]